MRTTLFFILSLLLGNCIEASAQSSTTLTGVVVDSTTKEALLGVQITAQSGAATNTDFIDGRYTLSLPQGEQILTFSYLGYATVVDTIVVGPETTVYNLAMLEAATLLETATVTSSKFGKSLGETTVSLQVVQPDLIENTNAVEVDEVLDKVPGITTMGDQVSIRGGAGFSQGTGSRVLVLLDGLPALQADAGLPNWGDLPTENIEQIEVLKGAASALYGSTAMNGVINVRTAQPTAKPFTKVSLFSTLYGNPADLNNKWWTPANQPFRAGLQMAHRRKWGKLDAVLGANLTYSPSFVRTYRVLDNGEIDSLPGYDHRARFTALLRYRHSERLLFTLNTNLNIGAQNVFLFHARVDPNLGLYESDFAPAPKGQNVRLTLDPAVTYFDKIGSRHRFQGRFYYINNNNKNRQSNQSNTYFGEYQFQRRFEQLDGLEIAAGLVATTIQSTAEVYGNQQYVHNNYAAYLQLDYKLWDKLSLSLGARYEINTTAYPDSLIYPIIFFGNQIGIEELDLRDTVEHRPVFRAGISYELTPATFLRVSWGQGYRFPTVLEKFIATDAGGITIAPNPDLVSETGWSAEIGIKQGFKIGKWQGLIDLAGFWSEYLNMMEFQAARELNRRFFNLPVAFQVQNIGNTRITGMDLSVMGQGRIGKTEIALLAGYLLLNPEYLHFEDSTVQADIALYASSDQNVLKYRNRHTIKTDVQVTYKGISLGITAQYLSFMESVDRFLEGEGNSFNPHTKIYEFRQKHNNGSFFVNLRAAYQVTDFLKVSVLVNNALNAEYALQPGRLEPPRNFSLRLDAQF